MRTLNDAAATFLNLKRIAVAGVSRSQPDAANLIYRKLRETGYQVFALNPHANEIEGDPCYPNLQAIPGGVEGVVLATTPQVTEQIVRECAQAGVRHVWMHRSLTSGSVSDEAVAYCQEHGIQVIPGACPMMFCEPVDFGHKCMRWLFNLTGRNPQKI
ncbi:MAG: CoA-binding protein [Anaerolineae bacterium]|nr:CoA-binding protein [Anaerolineae bacterium]